MSIREYRPAPSLNSVQHNFSGFEVELGVLHGARGWHIDKYGRLVGMSRRAVWTPGENTARCYQDQLQTLSSMCSQQTLSTGRVQVVHNPRACMCFFKQDQLVDDCASMTDCPSGHGFYAYHDGVVDYEYGGAPDAVGVIEGWGETVLGSRGFRCTKARITALSTPRACHAKLRELYGPDVALYDDSQRDRRRMLRDHPVDKHLSPDELITPENDPDFWTREVKFT